jgi:hypothetical protein
MLDLLLGEGGKKLHVMQHMAHVQIRSCAQSRSKEASKEEIFSR